MTRLWAQSIADDVQYALRELMEDSAQGRMRPMERRRSGARQSASLLTGVGASNKEREEGLPGRELLRVESISTNGHAPSSTKGLLAAPKGASPLPGALGIPGGQAVGRQTRQLGAHSGARSVRADSGPSSGEQGGADAARSMAHRAAPSAASFGAENSAQMLTSGRIAASSGLDPWNRNSPGDVQHDSRGERARTFRQGEARLQPIQADPRAPALMTPPSEEEIIRRAMQGDETWVRQNDRVRVRGMRNTNLDDDIDWTDAAWNYLKWSQNYRYMGEQVQRTDPRRAREYFELARQYYRHSRLAQRAGATFNSFQDQAEQDRERLSDMDAPRGD